MASLATHVSSAIALGTAVAVLLTVQFVPWADHESAMSVPMPSPYGAPGGWAVPLHLEITAYAWHGTLTMNGASESETWFSGQWDGDGIASIRAGALVLLTGLILAAAAFAANLLRYGNAAAAAGATASVLVLLGFLLYATGVDRMYGDAHHVWQAGFYLAPLAIVPLVVGSLLAAQPWERTSTKAPVAA